MSLSKYSEKVLTPDVGSKPHQPLTNFKFPYREFGKQKIVKRAFQHSSGSGCITKRIQIKPFVTTVSTVLRLIKKTSCEHQTWN